MKDKEKFENTLEKYSQNISSFSLEEMWGEVVEAGLTAYKDVKARTQINEFIKHLLSCSTEELGSWNKRMACVLHDSAKGKVSQKNEYTVIGLSLKNDTEWSQAFAAVFRYVMTNRK